MKVINKSTDKVITSHCEIANTFLTRLKGLTFSSYHHDLLLISPKEDIPSSSIHMFFMRFPLDVLWINSKMKVVDIKEGIPPVNFTKIKSWRIYKPPEPAKYVLELAVEKIKSSGTKLKDQVELIT